MPNMNQQGIWERLLLRFYRNSEPILRSLTGLRVLASLISLFLVVYYYGFPHSPAGSATLIFLTQSMFGFFVFSYLLRAFFSMHAWQYIKDTLFEAIVIGFLLIDVVGLLAGYPFIQNFLKAIELENLIPAYTFFVQMYLMVIVLTESTRLGSEVLTIRLKPATTLLFSFALLILAGTLLLMMPEMGAGGKPATFMQALFTSVSASCITGLSTVDIGTHFSARGHIVILMLIQIGGLGILTFATFFALFLKKGIGINHQAMIRDFMSEDTLFDAKSMLGRIIFFTFFIEAATALGLFILWDARAPFFHDPVEKAFQSVFHSISAFCNAGFSLMPQGLYQNWLRDRLSIHMLLAGTIFLGSLGFPALKDIFELNNIRQRIRTPWKPWKLSTRIAFFSSVALVIFGTLVFFLTERNGVLDGLSVAERWIHAIFQSVSPRTAGFNTVDMGTLSAPAVILLIFLMFIGGSSGSTAGGIKTSTFMVILLAISATIRGKNSLELGGRSISFELLNKAYTIFVFSSSFILISVFFLSWFEPTIPVLDLVFEEVSAFCTVGLTRGITPNLDIPAQMVLMISMFVGRVGTLTLAFSLASRTASTAYRYPRSHVLVG